MQNPFIPGYILAELHHHPERVAQLIGAVAGGPPAAVAAPMLAKLRAQIDAAVRAGAMAPIAAEQFLVNLLSLCIFPFAARPLLRVALGLDADGFARLIDARRTELPRFFLDALRP